MGGILNSLLRHLNLLIVLTALLSQLAASVFTPPPNNSDPCQTATLISENGRQFNNTGQNDKCDSNLLTDWYRFQIDGRSAEIPTACIRNNQCGTQVPLHVDLGENSLPGINETVMAHVCASYNILGRWDCCVLRKPMYIKNCEDYFVYYLQPADRCPVAYCLQVQNEFPSADITVKPNEPVSSSNTDQNLVNQEEEETTLVSNESPPSTTPTVLETSTIESVVNSPTLQTLSNDSIVPFNVTLPTSTVASETTLVTNQTSNNTSSNSTGNSNTADTITTNSTLSSTAVPETTQPSSDVNNTSVPAVSNLTTSIPTTASSNLTGNSTGPTTTSDSDLTTTNQSDVDNSLLTSRASPPANTTIISKSSPGPLNTSPMATATTEVIGLNRTCGTNGAVSFPCGNHTCFSSSPDRVEILCLVNLTHADCAIACDLFPECQHEIDESLTMCETTSCVEGGMTCPNKPGCHRDCDDEMGIVDVSFTLNLTLNAENEARVLANLSLRLDMKAAVLECLNNITEPGGYWDEFELSSIQTTIEDGNILLETTGSFNITLKGMSEFQLKALFQNDTFLDSIISLLLADNSQDNQIQSTISVPTTDTQTSKRTPGNATDGTSANITIPAVSITEESFTTPTVVEMTTTLMSDTTAVTPDSQTPIQQSTSDSNATTVTVKPVTPSLLNNQTSTEQRNSSIVESSSVSSIADTTPVSPDSTISDLGTSASQQNLTTETSPSPLTVTTGITATTDKPKYSTINQSTLTTQFVNSTTESEHDTTRQRSTAEMQNTTLLQNTTMASTLTNSKNISNVTTTATSDSIIIQGFTESLSNTSDNVISSTISSPSLASARTSIFTTTAYLPNTTIADLSGTSNNISGVSTSLPLTSTVRSMDSSTAGSSTSLSKSSISTQEPSTTMPIVSTARPSKSSSSISTPQPTTLTTASTISEYETTETTRVSTVATPIVSTTASRGLDTTIETKVSESTTRSSTSNQQSETTSQTMHTANDVSSSQGVETTTITTDRTSEPVDYITDALSTEENLTEDEEEDNFILKFYNQNTGLFIFLVIVAAAMFAVCIFGIGGSIYQKRMRTWAPDYGHYDDTYPDLEKTVISIGRERSGIESPITDIDILQGEQADDSESLSKTSTLVCGPTPDRVQGASPRSYDTPLNGTGNGVASLNGNQNEAYQSDESLALDGVTPFNELDEKPPRNQFEWIDTAEDTKV